MDTSPIERQEPAHWKGPAVFLLAVSTVIAIAFTVGQRHRSVHGADFFTGYHLDTHLRAPSSVVGNPVGHRLHWALTQGSGSLNVQFETVRVRGGSSVVSARVQPGGDLVDGVEAHVHITGYEPGGETTSTPIGTLTLQCEERAGDGVRTHVLELRGDGHWSVVNPEM
jgi:hypothetical protein